MRRKRLATLLMGMALAGAGSLAFAAGAGELLQLNPLAELWVPPPEVGMEPSTQRALQAQSNEAAERMVREVMPGLAAMMIGKKGQELEVAKLRVEAATLNMEALALLNLPQLWKLKLPSYMAWIGRPLSDGCSSREFMGSDWVKAARWVEAATPADREAFIAFRRELALGFGRAARPPARPANKLEDWMLAEFVQAGLPETPAAGRLPDDMNVLRASTNSSVASDQTNCASVAFWWLRLHRKGPDYRLSGVDAALYSMTDSMLDDWLEGKLSAASLPQGLLDRARARPGYPLAAALLRISGATTVRSVLDAAGRPISAEVTARRVDLPWLAGAAPAIFEHLFDDAAIRHAMTRQYPRPAAATALVPGWNESEFTYEITWNFDG